MKISEEIIKTIKQYSKGIDGLKNDGDYQNIVLNIGQHSVFEHQQGKRDDITIEIKRRISGKENK